MTRLVRSSTYLAVTLLTIGAGSGPAFSADVATRTPNIADLAVTAPGTWDFVFNHRLSGLATIAARPNFALETGITPWLSLYGQYATQASNVSAAGFDAVTGSHDLGFGLKEALLRQEAGAPLSLTLSEGWAAAGIYRASADKGDPEASWFSAYLYSNSPEGGAAATIARTFGPLGLLGTARAVGYGYAVAGGKMLNQAKPGYRASGKLGATLSLTPYLALDADWGKYLDGLSELPAWSAGIQGQIPFAPHLFSFEVSDVPSATLGGVSQVPGPNLYYGFSFSVAFKGISRWQKMLTPTWMTQPATAPTPAPAKAAEVSAPAVGMIMSAPAASSSAATPSSSTPAPAAEDPALIAKGKALFEGEAAGMGCAMCHGADAKGTDSAPSIRSKTVTQVKGAIASVESMSAFKTLSDADINAIAAYLKKLGS